jgi:hypothetical protein
MPDGMFMGDAFASVISEYRNCGVCDAARVVGLRARIID